MKIIFLDIDGVLCTLSTHFDYFDPACVYRLEKILEATDAKIILSSTWRLGLTDKQCKNMLRAGCLWRERPVHISDHDLLAERYLDRTDRIFETLNTRQILPERDFKVPESEGFREVDRGYEIDLKVKQYQPESFIILDDDSDMEPHMSKLIKTDPHLGLRDKDVETAIKMLNDG